MTRRPAILAFLLAVIVAFPAILFTVRHQTGRPIAQAVSNLVAVDQESFTVAIDRYPKYFAPLYPAILWGAKRAGVTPEIFNVAAQAILVGFVAAAMSTRHGSRSAASATLLLIALYPTARNVFQITAEPFFALLSFGTFLLVDRPDISLARAGAAGLLAGISALSRYFGLFWPTLPLLFALVTSRGTRAHKMARAGLAGAIVLALTLPWILFVRITTGHFSGASRQGAVQTGEFAHWNEHKDFATNVVFSAKSVLIDWLSPERIANHRAMIEQRITGTEWILFAAAIVLIAWGALAVRRAAPMNGETRSIHDLFLAAFFGVLIAVWSFANNDPIHTRFVFPVYPFLVVTGYAWAHRAGERVLDRLPFALLYVLCLVPSLLRHAKALAGPGGG